MIEHTPGPWESNAWEPGTIIGLPAGGFAIHTTWKNADGYSPLIATVQPNWSNCYNEANAQLIAAAPELLAALKEIESLLDCGNIEESHWQDCLGVARAAIAKAEKDLPEHPAEKEKGKQQ